MTFRVLGRVEVWDGERRLDLPSGRQRALLACLLLHRGAAISTERLVGELWPHDPPPTAAKIVRNLVSELRKVIGGTNGVALETEADGYHLRVPADRIDATRFEMLGAEGRRLLESGNATNAARTLREALALWHGRPYADLADEPFVAPEAERLEELRLACLEARFDADLSLGRNAELVPELEAEILREPFLERLRAQLMLALYRSGRQADALAAYQDARQTLTGELGLEPGRPLRELEARILAQDPTLDVTQTTPAVTIRRRGRTLIGLGIAAVLLAVAALSFTLARDDGPRGLAALQPGTVGAIDPDTSRLVAQVPLGAAVARAAGAGDTVWALSTTERTLYRVDASRRELTGTARIDGVVADVAAAGDDAWVMHAGASGDTFVTRYTGDQDVPLPLESVDLGVALTGATASTVGTVDDSIAADERTVWATTNAVRPRGGLSLVDVPGERVRGRLDVGPVYGLTPDDDSVWLVGEQLLRRLSADGTVDLELPLASPGVAIAVAVGEGAVWAVTTKWPNYLGPTVRWIGRSLITRVDPRAEAVATTIPVDGLPESVVAGLGSVWVIDAERHALLRIYPSTNAVVETIPLGA